MIVELLTSKFAWITAGLLGLGSLGMIAWRKIENHWEQKRKDDATNEEIKTLVSQRDSVVVDVASTDKLWDDYKKKH